MDDDGLLLNFAAPSATPARKEKVKVVGGSWKERRKRELALQGRGRSSRKSQNPTSGVNNSSIGTQRVLGGNKNKSVDNQRDSGNNINKRSSTDSSTEAAISKKPRVDPGKHHQEKKGEFGGKNSSYVSSLFTNNNRSTLNETDESKSRLYDPSNAPINTSSFSGLGLNEKLTKHLNEVLRFKSPTKVQQLVLPHLLSKTTDLYVRAQTGSGKTLAFLLPIFLQIMLTPDIHRESGLFALILVPTRELATQIYGVMESIARCCHHIVPGIVIGGEKKKSEKARLRKGVNILVATPGRLVDHMENTKLFDTSQVRWLVLDEGDKLMELGFEETITKITARIDTSSKLDRKWVQLPKKRINVLCSATIQDNVKKLGEIILDDPQLVSVEGKEGTIEIHDGQQNNGSFEQSAPDQLVQKVLVVPPKLRLVTLAAVLKDHYTAVTSGSRTIVFFSCSDSVDFHFDVFTRNGLKFKKSDGEIIRISPDADDDDDDDEEEEEDSNKDGRRTFNKKPSKKTAPTVLTAPLIGNNVVIHKLHGSLSQQVRTSTLQLFVNEPGYQGAHSILFCTDVASRGLDLPKIGKVVEFDPPFSVEDHLHRIGRTARVGQEGTAILFLLPGIEEGYVDGQLRIVHPKESNLRIEPYEKVLAKGFGEKEDEASSSSNKKADAKHKTGKWDIHATTFHLDVERWLLEDQTAHDLAGRAFTSHIRAYATHLSSERQYFNVKLLHLGHLAKAFGLRETPKKLGRAAGLPVDDAPSKKSRSQNEDPRKKMLRMAKLAVKSASSEFNY